MSEGTNSNAQVNVPKMSLANIDTFTMRVNILILFINSIVKAPLNMHRGRSAQRCDGGSTISMCCASVSRVQPGFLSERGRHLEYSLASERRIVYALRRYRIHQRHARRRCGRLAHHGLPQHVLVTRAHLLRERFLAFLRGVSTLSD